MKLGSFGVKLLVFDMMPVGETAVAVQQIELQWADQHFQLRVLLELGRAVLRRVFGVQRGG